MSVMSFSKDTLGTMPGGSWGGAGSGIRRGKPMPLHWGLLHDQFGPGWQVLRTFKPKFRVTLETALVVYPTADVKLLDNGLLLHPSPPPVAPSRRRLSAVGR